MQKLEIGKIVNTFGIKGVVKVKPFTDDITRFEKLKEIYINNKIYEIQEVSYKKDMVFLKLKNIDTIEQANLLRDNYIEIDRKDGIKLEEGTYFIVDLIGCKVYTEDKVYLGKIDDVFNNGSHDVYVVKSELGKQILLPAIKDIILNINIQEKKIIVHLLKGLIE